MHYSIIDLTGQRFGKLVVLNPIDERKNEKVVWHCLCDCGNSCFIRGSDLRKGHTQSCGCLLKEKITINLTGQKFGRLTVIESTKKREGSSIVWRCLCRCGKETFVSSKSLRAGHTKSCGCLQKEIAAKLKTVHGMHGTCTYKTWDAMIQRCENPNNLAYKNYGGRGVLVCERWHDFRNFYEDMGECPKGLTVDRINNDGNYEPGNCKWSTRKEQQNNRRPVSSGSAKQHWFFAFNENTGEWFEDNNQARFARQHGLALGCVSQYLCNQKKTNKGWTFEFLPYQA